MSEGATGQGAEHIMFCPFPVRPQPSHPSTHLGDLAASDYGAQAAQQAAGSGPLHPFAPTRRAGEHPGPPQPRREVRQGVAGGPRPRRPQQVAAALAAAHRRLPPVRSPTPIVALAPLCAGAAPPSLCAGASRLRWRRPSCSTPWPPSSRTALRPAPFASGCSSAAPGHSQAIRLSSS